MKDSSIVNRIEHLQFGYYSSEEVRRLSIKEIKNPMAFDQLQRPLANGLYDPALGISPYDKWSRCQTCGQEGIHCQGHLGHIELLVPVYNPFLLPNLMKLLKSMCLKCSRLRLTKSKVHQYVEQLVLIKLGYLSAAAQYDQAVNNRLLKTTQTTTKKDMVSGSSAYETSTQQTHKERKKDKAIQQYVEQIMAELYQTKNTAQQLLNPKDHPEHFGVPVEDTQQIQRALKEKTTELYSQINAMTCPHCQTPAHNIKKEGSSKLFLTQKSQDKKQRSVQMYLNVIEVRDYLKRLFSKEKAVLSLLFGQLVANQSTLSSPKGYHLMSNTYQMFFIEVLAVTPNRFRPENKMDDQTFLHSHTVIYTKVINLNADLRKILVNQKQEGQSKREEGTLDKDDNIDNIELKKVPISQIKNEISLQTLVAKWLELQDSVNTLFDSSKALKASERESTGIRQLLEKKEGLFRMKMMGKRVNFTARSVISPDPYLDTNEVGVPLFVAKRLSFPEGVNEHNVERLRQMVINGPHVWPGANSIEDQGVLISLDSRSKEEREGLASLLLTHASHKKVMRHLVSGDVVMFNRQPTLHRPSLMSHIARVLPKENTIRMHYANCSSYNADFDGDEMNLHFLQNQLARSEAYHLSLNDHNYILAKNGAPIRGLIQDSVLSGAMVTSKDSFIEKELFQQLVYISTWQYLSGPHHKLSMPRPALIKPRALYTGKQLITTIIKNLVACELGQEPDQKKGLYMDKGSKIPADIFGMSAKDESLLYVQDNEVIHGLIDKNQIGSTDFGLVHSFYELYGPKMTGKLLTSLARLFSAYLQFNGFSAGMEDLYLSDANDVVRKELITKAHLIGTKAGAVFAGETSFETPQQWKLFNRPLFDGTDDKVYKRVPGKDYLPATHPLLHKIQEKIVMEPQGSAELDMTVKQQLNVIVTDIFKLTNYGLRRQYPENLFSTMVLTGAKGSNVNHNQISIMLGQQELEGRRVPITAAGKSLPCFVPYDPNPRAGGFISDRFLTGLRPQEFYFHCMAGREGLIDTAVKTSRSGYLQRCLVKHLEGLKVAYDYTVRDSDDSILQFHYGEDSIDSTRNKFLHKFNFITNNYNGFVNKYQPKNLSKVLDTQAVKAFLKARKQDPSQYQHQTILSNFYPGTYLGAISEMAYTKISEYIKAEKHKQEENKPSIFDDNRISDKKLFSLFNIKYFNSLIQPGECVGPIAAQSVGEPSTQMTLNTFHLAGHGGANVTLGIPRLREILMTAAKQIKTPSMTLPFSKEAPRKDPELAEQEAKKLQHINLKELVNSIEVREETILASERYRRYRLKVKFEDAQAIEEVFGLNEKKLSKVMEKLFSQKLLSLIHKEVKKDLSKSSQAKILQADEQLDKEETRKDTIDSAEEDSEEEKEEKKEQHKEKEKVEPSQYEHFSKQMLHYFHGMKFKRNCFNMQLKLPLNAKKLLMLQLVEQALQHTILNEIPGITRCVVIKDKSKEYALQTEGVNFYKIWAMEGIDQNRVECNDIHQIITFYGIEAGRLSIINEINRVFSVYHIQVDFRHLSLIADYMTYLGSMRALNRMGISVLLIKYIKGSSFSIPQNDLRDYSQVPM